MFIKQFSGTPFHFSFPMYAFVADIQRAFLNIQLQETDRPFVRCLWYKDNDPSKEISVYTYNREITHPNDNG